MTLQPELLDGLATLATAGLGWLSWQVRGLIQAKVKDANARRALLLIDEAVQTAAKMTQQTVVGRLKAKGGKLTPQGLREVKSVAYEAAMASLGTSGRILAEQALGHGVAELRAIIEARLEAAVHDLRAK